MLAEQTDFLRDIWYSAMPARELRPGALAHRMLLGEPVVFGRGRDGKAFALRDICPHRGILLSAGRLRQGATGEPEVECPYHGWRFGPDGGCRAIPSLVPGQDMDVSRIKVRAYPARELQGNIWIYMPSPGREGAEPDSDPPEVPLIGDREPALVETMTFSCDVDHAVIGLMDPAHGPFVHGSWWWRTQASIHEKAKSFHPTPYGFAMTSHKPSSNSFLYKLLGGEVSTEITFRLPGLRFEAITAGKNKVLGLTTVTPVSATQTEVRQAFYWTMPWLALVRPFFRPFAKTFLDQDRTMVDLQAEGLKHNPRLMLIDDSDMQAKWYFRLKKEWQASHAEGRPFKHPIEGKTVLRWRS